MSAMQNYLKIEKPIKHQFQFSDLYSSLQAICRKENSDSAKFKFVFGKKHTH